MNKRPRVKISLVNKLGKYNCHKGHKIGDTWDFDNDRGEICSLAMHTLFPMVDILRYGGKLPSLRSGETCFCCPDVDVINVFKIEEVDE